ncbi:MAG TPA: FmdB family zinc ribbon protein [Vicinamibacterales bacterium]|nr:FmdB family zinc ribbon protein [Vicinamibacterales bacterium]
MPIYEYQCEKCGHRVEKIQRFSDPPLETCEKCGGAVHKVQSAPAFQFKGTGWYVTDYAKSGKTGPEEKKAEPAKSDSTASTTSSSPSTTTTDTKSGS